MQARILPCVATYQSMADAASKAYVGRFAPSPTGPLHFGSLLTAVASFCDARAQGGRWLVRIEDSDIPRIQAGATSVILSTLDAFGLYTDGPVLQQQDRLDVYEIALQTLANQDLTYRCYCSRKALAGYTVYPKHCRLGASHFNISHQADSTSTLPYAIRLKVPHQTVEFYDAIQGYQADDIARSTGDFILKRRDGTISYQLAVVVDDAAQGVTHVVRGADLLDNTARQIYLGQCLAVQPLHYAHIPLAMNANGQKLSKQNLAAPLDVKQAPTLLTRALHCLGQPILYSQDCTEILSHAIEHWSLDGIPNTMQLPNPF